MKGVLSGSLFLAGLFLAAWRANRCPISDDGTHAYMNETDGKGWFLRCVDCRHRTEGIDAFARKVS